MVRNDHSLVLIAQIEHMEKEKRTNHRLTLEELTEKYEEVVAITVSGNAGKNLDTCVVKMKEIPS